MEGIDGRIEMTNPEARLRIAVHAGRSNDFSEGYRYALRHGSNNVLELQQKFDDIFLCLKQLKDLFYFPEVERELLADVNEIMYGSILYCNHKGT